MTGRSIPDEANKYRFGFNGKENDDNKEWGQSLVQDYGFRLYNPAIGKFLSVDPLAKSYPFYTPYAFAGGRVIMSIDLDGLEDVESITEDREGNQVAVLKPIDFKENTNGYYRISSNGNLVGYWSKTRLFKELSTNSHFLKHAFPQLPEKTQGEWFKGAVANDPNKAKVALATVGLPASIVVAAEVGAMLTVEAIVEEVSTTVFTEVTGVDIPLSPKDAVKDFGEWLIKNQTKTFLKRRSAKIASTVNRKTGEIYDGIVGEIESWKDVHKDLLPYLKKKEQEIKKLGKEKDWSVFNCAECSAMNNAIKNGAKLEDLLEPVSLEFKKGKFHQKEMCSQCEVIWKNKKN